MEDPEWRISESSHHGGQLLATGSSSLAVLASVVLQLVMHLCYWQHFNCRCLVDDTTTTATTDLYGSNSGHCPQRMEKKPSEI